MGNVVSIPSRVAALSLDDMTHLHRLLKAYSAELTERGYPRLAENQVSDVIKLALDDLKPPEERDRRRDPGALQHLRCDSCGKATKGRQWQNHKFGVCPNCVKLMRDRGTSDEEIHELYGQEGIHWGEF